MAGVEPDGDSRGGPLGSIDATANSIEAGAEILSVVRENGAACVFALGGSVGVTVGGVGGTGHAGLSDGAVGRGMEGHGVSLGAVDSFDDVDFARSRPIGADEPKGGPDAADAAGHVGDVGEEEATVEGFFAGDADALAARVGGGIVVDAHVSGVAVVAHGADHLFLHSGGVVDVFDEAGRGVGFGKGGEGVEEVGAFVGVGEDIACYAHAEEGCESQEAGEAVEIHVGFGRVSFDCGRSKV